MSYDLEFLAISKQRGALVGIRRALETIKSDIEHERESDAGALFAPFLEPGVSEEELRAYVLPFARRELEGSSLVDDMALDFVIEQLFDLRGGPARVPCAISTSGNVKEFRQVMSRTVARTRGVLIYDPQRLSFDHGSEQRQLANIFDEPREPRSRPPWRR